MQARQIQRVADELVQAGLEAGASFRFRIVSESMRPTLRPGDDVIVQQVHWRQLRAGDIVLCESGRLRLAHRLLAVRHHNGEPQLLTKGDAAWNLDAPNALDAYRGTILRIERAGRVHECNRTGFRIHARVRAWLSLSQAMLMQCYRKLKRQRAWIALMLIVLLLFGAASALAAVTISSFSATGGNNQITLNWSTATELKNFGFDVERSPDQSAWSRIAFVPTNYEVPCTQSFSTLNYSYVDKNLPAGTKYYYRLKMIGSPCADADTYYEQIVNATTNGVAPSSTNTPTPTNTPAPTNPAPPTRTTVPSGTPPPTNTPTPTQTSTPRPTNTQPPTATTVPRPSTTTTLTPNLPSNTATPTTVNTATRTALPATTTATVPTATPSIAATATPSAAATATVAASATPTVRSGYPLPTLTAPAPIESPTAGMGSPTPTQNATPTFAATSVAIVVATEAPGDANNNPQSKPTAATGDANTQGTSPNATSSTPGATSVEATSATQNSASALPFVVGIVVVALLGAVGVFAWQRRRPRPLDVLPPPSDEK